VNAVSGTAIYAKKPVFPGARGKKIIKGIPYICQQGRLDCGYVSCAMLIGRFNKQLDTLFYPKLVYESTGGYGFVYSPGFLNFPFTGWLDETFHWLSSLYGLSFERVNGTGIAGEKRTWHEYINRIWDYLQKDTPVQVFRSWSTREIDGRMYTPEGLRPFWWESVLKSHRPDKHALVIVGLDWSRGIIYINDPGCGWFGKGEYEEMSLIRFKELTKALPPEVKYSTRVFSYNDLPIVDEGRKSAMIEERIIDKIKGNPLVYDDGSGTFLYGLKGIAAMKKDLNENKFSEILEYRLRKEGMMPVEVIRYLILGFYQYVYITGVTAGYLEAAGDVKEYEEISKLHILYEKLYILSNRLLNIFRTNNDFNKAVRISRPILKEMRDSLGRLELFFQDYLDKQLVNKT
jgi:hypothetical protein